MNFLLLIFAAIIFRVYLIFRDSVPFAYDMGRDLLWAKDIVFYKEPTLIGPAASIWGVYFGPLWYYFLSIPLIFSIIILFSSQMINLSLFAFPANITPILTLCMIYFLFLAVTKNPLFISASF